MCARPSPPTRDGEPLHERSRLVRALRAGVIRSNAPPLSSAYAGAYRAVRALAVSWLRRRFGDDLEAVYLRGSAVMDVSVPALSDIDLTIVLRDAVDTARHEAVVAAWRRLATRVPVLESEPWILPLRELRKLGEDNPAVRYRIMEAQRSWACVLGRDALAGLDRGYDRARRLQAVAEDVELRLTYLNGLLFEERPDDALQRARLQYMLYKLTLDLARALAYDGEATLLGRGEVAEAFLAGELAIAPRLGEGDDALLRQLVAATRRHRLRRSFLGSAGVSPMRVCATLVDHTVRTLGRMYRDRELRALPGVLEQHEHFYADDRFLPTGDRVRPRAGALPEDFAAFRARVTEDRRRGVHTLLVRDGLWVNLANTAPALGNCTVVPAPEASSGPGQRGTSSIS